MPIRRSRGSCGAEMAQAVQRALQDVARRHVVDHLRAARAPEPQTECVSPGWRITTSELSTSDLNASASVSIGGNVS